MSWSFIFLGKRVQRMPLTLNQWTPFLAVTVEYVWVTVQTKVNRCISPRKRKSKVERKTERVRERRKDWKMAVAVWHRECDSVMQTGFIVSSRRPGEIISSQYGVYQSSQNTTLPSRYMSRLSACLCLSVCLSACCSHLWSWTPSKRAIYQRALRGISWRTQ